MKLHTDQKRRMEHSFMDDRKLDLRHEIQENFGSQPVPWFHWVFDALNLPPGSRILELGCGTGTLWLENKQRIPKQWDILLTDRAIEMTRSAQMNLAPVKHSFHLAAVDGQVLPFLDESFDAILAVGLLDLIPDLQLMLSEVWRVLRPGGLFLVTAGGAGHLQEMEGLLKPFITQWDLEQLGGNEKHFGLENGESLLAPFFEEVTRREYHDLLEFHSLQPILDYVLSEQALVWSLPLGKLGGFVRRIKHSLTDNGTIGVTVHKGMFLARKKTVY